jgi:hypothetical protein
MLYAEYLPASFEPGSDNRAYGGVHSRRIASACHNRYAIHLFSKRFSAANPGFPALAAPAPKPDLYPAACPIAGCRRVIVNPTTASHMPVPSPRAKKEIQVLPIQF